MSRRGERRAMYSVYGREKWSNEGRRRRRELGQNFLKDKRVARRIVDESGVGGEDLVVEFGAGGGMLTRQLARVARRVVAVERDPRWAARLKRRFSETGNVRVVQGDALVVGLPVEPFVVVANIPFNLTTPVLRRLLDDPASPPEKVCLLVQKQVALKHARSVPTTLRTLDWSPWYRFSAGLELPSGAFHPEPEVDARLLAAIRRDSPLVDPRYRGLFRTFARRAFEGSGNGVGRTLRPFFTRTQLRRLARDNGFALESPPSMLTVHQWASVFGFMVRIAPRERWPSAGRRSGRDTRRR